MVQVTDYAGQCVKSKRPEAAEGLYMSASRVLDPNLEYYYYLGPTELRKSCFSVIKSYQLTPLACCFTFTSTLSGTKDFCNSQYQVDQKADRPTSSCGSPGAKCPGYYKVTSSPLELNSVQGTIWFHQLNIMVVRRTRLCMSTTMRRRRIGGGGWISSTIVCI